MKYGHSLPHFAWIEVYPGVFKYLPGFGIIIHPLNKILVLQVLSIGPLQIMAFHSYHALIVKQSQILPKKKKRKGKKKKEKNYGTSLLI